MTGAGPGARGVPARAVRRTHDTAQSGMGEEFRRPRESGASPPPGIAATTDRQDAPDRAGLWPDEPGVAVSPGGAVPTVAALCAPVRSAFPSLTAAQLAGSVLAGTEPITGREFHRPNDHADGLTPGSRQAVQDSGARRAVLRRVLARARDTSGIAHISAHPALEPAARATP